MSSEPAAGGPVEAPASISIVALAGIPEIHLGDDLPALIGDAIERTPGALPLGADDVLVVTQKIVSKAEGAIVELDTVQPRPEAIAFAERYDRDPRQIEVVLREARRVVRMTNGVLITETPHGFICANGGVDASNVGPDSGALVTLLPRDPDASAARIRSAVHARFDVDVSRSSSRIRSGGRGAGGSRTSRSASRGWSRSKTCAASPTPTAGSCARPFGRSPTSLPRPRSWSSARPPPAPSRSSGERRSAAARARSPTS